MTDNNNGKEQFCDETETWIIEYALKHNMHAVVDEVAKLHPHVDSSLFDNTTAVRLGLAGLSRLALSSSIKDVNEALEFSRCLFNILPDAVSVRHRTKVVYGLRIRAVILSIEKDLPMNEVERLLDLHFKDHDSQEPRMHSTVFEVSKKGALQFTSHITSYISDPTTAGRRQLLDTYSVISPQNSSFRTTIESFVSKYAEYIDAKLKKTHAGATAKEIMLEKMLRIFNILNETTSDSSQKLTESMLLRLLNAVHVRTSDENARMDIDSLLQLFCTAPEN